jgi:HAD superfamily hydrolase (TIGR01509 family)
MKPKRSFRSSASARKKRKKAKAELEFLAHFWRWSFLITGKIGAQPFCHLFGTTSLNTLIIYDCDGTLIDSETIAGEEVHRAIASFGMDYTLNSYNAKFTGVPAPRTWELLAEERGVPFPDGTREAVDGRIHARFAQELSEVDGVKEALAALPLPHCVASSTGMPHLRKNLAKVGLLPLFDPHVFSASQVKRGKPAPDVFLFAASQMGFDPAQCLVVEDSVNGVMAARRAGMPVLGFTGAGHAFDGLGDRLSKAGALEIVPHMRDLPAAITKFQRH